MILVRARSKLGNIDPNVASHFCSRLTCNQGGWAMNQDRCFVDAKPSTPPDRTVLSHIVTVRVSPSEADRVAMAAGDARQSLSAFGRHALLIAAGDSGR